MNIEYEAKFTNIDKDEIRMRLKESDRSRGREKIELRPFYL